MNDSEQNLNEVISEDWCVLEKLISNQVSPLPDEVLDKQILATAHREMSTPKKRQAYQISWLRKLSLPLYVTAGFTFSVLAFKSIWQAPEYHMDQDSNQSITVDMSQKPNQPQKIPLESTLIKRQLPELLVAPDSPKLSSKEQLEAEIEQQNNQLFTSEINAEKIYTGSHLSKAIYPEKDAWARKIINFMKNGESETARLELIRFKKVYPDYPIEEQIKVLNR